MEKMEIIEKTENIVAVKSPETPPIEAKPKTIKQKKEEFETIVKHYLESNPHITSGRKSNELEIRFGTNTKLSRPISKIDYDNVVKQLYSYGFKPEVESGIQILRIACEYTDVRTGKVKMSNIRAELVGSDIIQEYCRTNSIQRIIDMPSTVFNKLKFTQKNTAVDKSGTFIQKLDMDDFNFRVSFQTEQDYNIQSNVSRNIISRWEDSKKMFRSMNRVRFYHPDYPIFADLSIVKMSKKTNRVVMPEYTIQEAGVFNNMENYEIELEVDNSKVGTGTDFDTVNKLMDAVRKSIRIVLGGLQGTKYPISYVERDTLLQSYMRLIHGEKYEKPRRVYPSDFIGPSSNTLQIENIQPTKEGTNINSILKNYTVTDKADGERKLLYIAEDGKIYMIDTNMNVIFTGVKTGEKTIFDSLLDGEHIKYDKNNNFINLYAAFDIYFVNKKSVRELTFLQKSTSNEEQEPATKFRLGILQKLISIIKPISIMESIKKEKSEVSDATTKQLVDFSIRCKNFYYDTDRISIFDCCSKILTDIKDGLFEYNTDGLIFTPADLAVGANTVGALPSSLSKSTWDKSFKWKPPEFNTIDFLVSIKKDKTGKDEVHYVFEEGSNLQGTQNVLQYKTLILRCGFDERKHGFINPFQDIIEDKLPSPNDIDNEETYKPVPFQPTEPYDPNACYCDITLKQDGSRIFMTTEEGEYFEEDMIVEFKYVIENEKTRRWIPIRVRYDKTSELRAGLKNYGNAYHVANSNWYSIHHPITDAMISTGQNIPDVVINDDIYYNRTSKTDESNTVALRNFHNLFVKNKLITGVANRGDTLIDYAVGKGGDLSKWIFSKLSFVFGVDISKDNIENKLDGACARYLKERRKYGDSMPRAVFVNGNSALNIRDGKALYTEKEKQITNAIFGKGAKDATLLGKGIYRSFGIGESGFNISSCQFAMHYFFENKTTLHEFLRNITECTKINGCFIGTCYDGRTVFDRLHKYKKGENWTIFKNDSKIFEMTKMYDETGFPNSEESLGYAINVFQESINMAFREYLVNFDYFIQVMEDYGFVLLKDEELKKIGLPSSSGLFRELYVNMENEIHRNKQSRINYKKAAEMSVEEKQISFLNRYFIFRKVREVDAKKMAQVILKQDDLIERNGEEAIKEIEENLKKSEPVEIEKSTKQKLIIKKPTKQNSQVPIDNPIEPPSSELVEVKQIIPTGQPLKLKIRNPNASRKI
jgi:mRNA (guanine-N7-)-methyltransferase